MAEIEGKGDLGGDIYRERDLIGGEENGGRVGEKINTGLVVDTEHKWDSVRRGGWGTRVGTCSGWRGSGGRQRWGLRWRNRLLSLKLGPLTGAQPRV